MSTARMCSVCPVEPVGWWSPFMVDDTTLVRTVDVYTYKCTNEKCIGSCREHDCDHVHAVTDYVIRKLEEKLNESPSSVFGNKC